MKNITLYALIALLSTGCSVVRPATSEYTILPAYASENKVTPAIKATLKLAATRSIPSLACTQFYYLKDATRIDAYLYSRWSDSPAGMIDRALYSSMQNQQLFESLIPAASSAATDLLLESNLDAFYHRFTDNIKSEGFIDITYRLIDPKTKKIIASKRFIIREPSVSPDAKGGVEALNNATRSLCSQCIAWLNLTLEENPWKK